MNFTAIDFETATPQKHTICQIGLVKVVDGLISEKLSILVKPPHNYYWEMFTDIHGISAEKTFDAPSFKSVWFEIEPFITNQNVVAHNGFRFDFIALEEALKLYKIMIPEYMKHCTYKIYGKGLAQLCNEYNIKLNHHDALSDAEACAKLFMNFMNDGKK